VTTAPAQNHTHGGHHWIIDDNIIPIHAITIIDEYIGVTTQSQSKPLLFY